MNLISKRWPAEDVAPLIALIDDPEHPVHEDGTYQLSEAQVKAILICASTVLQVGA